jgi:hypothetical protein
MKSNVRDAATIAGRHRQDAVEGGRTCRACGCPWPCDVRLIAVALEVGEMRRATHPTTVSVAPTSAADRVPIKAATRSRTRRSPEVTPVPA